MDGGQDGAGGQRPALRAGWRSYHDPTGFSVYVPAGWNRSREGSIVYFRDPKTGRVLGIDQTNHPRPDPVADSRGQASYRVARGDFPAYRETRIAAVPYWLDAADWEFTFNGRGPPARQQPRIRHLPIQGLRHLVADQRRRLDSRPTRPAAHLGCFRPAQP